MNPLRSRRPDPSTWTSDQIRSLVVAAYVGDYSEGPREPYYGQSEFTLPGYNDGRAAVVFHLPEKMMPRRVIRDSRSSAAAHGCRIAGMHLSGARRTSTTR